MTDARAFITANLCLEPVAGLPEIRLYQARPHSRLRRLTGDDAPPYWAYQWAGGAVLARHVLNCPDIVKGRRVLDLGTGSGVVAIAAALSGAASVLAADIDPFAISATGLNAEANDVAVTRFEGDLLDGPAPDCDLITLGDVFYEARLARRVTAALEHWGIDAVVGDTGRASLPLDHLEALARYDVPDFGRSGLAPATVFRFARPSRPPKPAGSIIERPITKGTGVSLPSPPPGRRSP